LIREIGRERTVLLSTHILSEAQQMCNRVLIINRGHIVAEDSPERLQARLTGAQKIILRVDGNMDGLDTLVRNVEGINRVKVREDASLEFESSPGIDLRPEVARAVVGAGYDLLEIRPVGVSLEEIFLQLTRDEPVVATAEPESEIETS
jgi:ABC-2 type transport system ATP-binding protein